MPRWPSHATAPTLEEQAASERGEVELIKLAVRPLRSRVLGALRAADTAGDTATSAALSGVASALGDLFAAAQKGGVAPGLAPAAALILDEIMAL
jgi:hypothetical protein